MAAADSLTTGLVLQDLGGVILVTLAFGLVFHGIRRSIFGGKSRGEPSPAIGIPGPLNAEVPPLPGQKRQAGVDSSHFTWWDLLICSVVLFFFVIPIILIDSDAVQDSLKAVDGAAENADSVKMKTFFAQIFMYIMLTTMIITMIQWVGMRNPVVVLGLKNQSFRSVLIWVALASVVAVYSVNWVSGFSSAYTQSLFGEMELQAPVKSLQNSESLTSQIMMVFTAVILAPLFEELVFRGYFYGILKKFTDPMFAAFTSGAVFALIHMNLPAVLPLWFFAIFLTLTYEASRSLWVPIGIHAVFNAVTVTMIFLSKNEEVAPIEDAVTSFGGYLIRG